MAALAALVHEFVRNSTYPHIQERFLYMHTDTKCHKCRRALFVCLIAGFFVCVGWLSDTLEVGCENHNTITKIQKLSDFDLVPEGGCSRRCEYSLPCGHQCTRRCHPDDAGHAMFVCRGKCARNGAQCNPPRSCAHACKKKCNEDCGECHVCCFQ